jgi:hypothetical protein
MAETDLYAPIKQFLEAQGYAVKGEIGACDVVGVRGDEDAVVVELKERLNFALLLQAVVAVLDPAPYTPRANARRRERLLKEFAERVGDPEVGGSTSRQRLTAYRQDALRCARELSSEGTLKVSMIRERADVERAGPILRDNHYGWFERVKTGYYELSPKGERELVDWSGVLDKL